MVFRLLGLALLFLVSWSCHSGGPQYEQRVKALADDQVSPRLTELARLLENKPIADAESLVLVWKEWLTDQPFPLQEDSHYTFVYYDFSGTLTTVWFEASFAPSRPEPMQRWGQTHLYFRVFDIPKPGSLRYRFLTTAKPDPAHRLADPFNPFVDPNDEAWSCLPDVAVPRSEIQQIEPAAEPDLNGQGLRIDLPADYLRNLAATYPFLLVLGTQTPTVISSLRTAQESISAPPMVIVSLTQPQRRFETADHLRSYFKTQLWPWLKQHYRLLDDPSRQGLFGVGDSAPMVRQVRDEGWADFGHFWVTDAEPLTAKDWEPALEAFRPPAPAAEEP